MQEYKKREMGEDVYDKKKILIMYGENELGVNTKPLKI